MAENLAIEGRMSVRSPMQWSDERNGGFSTAPQDRLRRPVVKGKKWGPATINVANQQRDRDSLLNWMARLVRRRRETPEIVFGSWTVVPVAEAAVLALCYEWGSRTVLVAHNLDAAVRTTSFRLEGASGWEGLIDVFGEGRFSLDGDGTVTIELDGYRSLWLRVRHASGNTPV